MTEFAADVVAFGVAYGARGAALLAIAAIGVLCLRRASAAARHAVWLAAFVALLALPAAMLFAPEVVVAKAAIPANPVVRSLVLIERRERIDAPSERPNAMAATSGAELRAVPQGTSTRTRGVPTPETGLALVWLLGFVACIARVGADLWRARRLVRLARPVDVNVPVRRGTRVLVSADVATPLTTGVIRPAVILPADYTGWNTSDLQSVVAHEAGHVARHDCATQLLARVACAVHWFNPLAWYAARAMRAEAERACDDRVLHTDVSPVSYAALLVGFARSAGDRHAIGTALPMAARGRELEQRIRSIVSGGVRRGGCTRRQMIAIGAAATTCSVALTAPRVEAAVGRATAPVTRATVAESAPATAPVTPSSASQAPVRQIAAPDTEPDDERIPLDAGIHQKARAATATLTGEDSVLAARLFAALDREPLHDGDLVAERATWALALADGFHLVDPLMEALGSRDWREVAYAAWALGYSGNGRAVPLLINALGHSAWRVRANASSALVALGDPRAAAAMHVALNDAAWQVRVEAVEFIGALGDAESLSAIRPMVRDPHIAVRGKAQAALLSRRSPQDQ